ncbi:MAG: efflux RND transporter periplasmic adaptor subunit [Muribaculaceae bacterium]|nr:efflux RND transporter periplasmic adaptor subunit [Muribaculaceae bacterium]
MANENNQNQKNTAKGLLISLFIVVLAVAAIAVAGFVFMNKPDDFIEGQAEGTTVRISGKLPGRIVEFYVQEGDSVHAGDTLVCIHSAVVEAQLTQAEAMQEVAQAQNRKVDAGTRRQIIQSAYDIWQQAKAAVEITGKTYQRMQRLYEEGVMSEQKRDEAKAAYDAAKAGAAAAESQYNLAVSGAQKEDKESTAAMVSAAHGGVEQVQAVLDDAYLTAPFDGTIDQIYPEVGELVALGAPIMNLLRTDKRWITFNVREELLNDLAIGKKIKVMVPALGKKEIEVEVYFIRDMGTYATWRSTKATGEWDSRTFQIKARPTEKVDGLRPGMSIIYKP